MIFWVIAGFLTALAVAGLLLPLLRRPRPAAARGAYDLRVYRDQLAEIERDVQRGEIGAEPAATARAEVERRMLATDQQSPAETASRPATRWALGVVLVVALPVAVIGLYLFLGAPGGTSLNFAERRSTADEETQAAPALNQLAERLAARLAAAPDDRDGWLLLGRTYTELGQPSAAAGAYGQAIARGFDDAPIYAALGEALTAAAGGQVVPEARQAFATALERDPAEARANYYAGLALAQDGRMRDAVATWTTLLRQAPPGAPWRDFLARQVREAAAAIGEPTPPEAAETAVAPPAGAGAAGPSQAEVDAAGQMSEADRAAFIRTMVGRLASRLEAQPDDLDGWLRLTRAYAVLGETERARAALARAEALAQALPTGAPERAAVEAARQALPAP